MALSCITALELILHDIKKLVSWLRYRITILISESNRRSVEFWTMAYFRQPGIQLQWWVSIRVVPVLDGRRKIIDPQIFMILVYIHRKCVQNLFYFRSLIFSFSVYFPACDPTLWSLFFIKKKKIKEDEKKITPSAFHYFFIMLTSYKE